jgi:uncharacterized membrane protein
MTEVRKTPVHLWIVGVVSLLWNAVGAFDYTMTKMQNAEYLAAFTPEQQAWFATFPLWANIGYGLGIWGSFIGSAAMMLRSRHAVTLFAVSFAGAAVSHLGQALAGVLPVGLTVMIMGVIAALWWYCRRSAGQGILR